MPTYEYQCTACKHAFEQFQSMKDKALQKCPKCGKAKLERLIGIGAAVLFKGSGFYQTDYRSESYTKAKDADAKAGSPPAGTSDGAATTAAKASTSDGGAGESGSSTKSSEKTSAKPAAAGEAKPESKSALTSKPKKKR
jgi:putative FmdB family regulatory protein